MFNWMGQWVYDALCDNLEFQEIIPEEMIPDRTGISQYLYEKFSLCMRSELIEIRVHHNVEWAIQEGRTGVVGSRGSGRRRRRRSRRRRRR